MCRLTMAKERGLEVLSTDGRVMLKMGYSPMEQSMEAAALLVAEP